MPFKGEHDFTAPELTNQEVIDHVMAPVGSSSLRGNIVIVILGMIAAWGGWKFWQMTQLGMFKTGLGLPAYWGFYISTFVFWIGVAHAGALISAILRITGAEWKSTVTRIAEVITLFTLPAAASFPLIHIGRNGVFFYLIPYPNWRHLWPNFRSPLLWDFFAISTYFTGSVLFLYSTLIPDLGMLRQRVTGWKRTVYTILSWGWRGTQPEWKRLREAAALFSILILPVVISVHTIVSWDFAMQLVPGWHETVFGPYFFVGALFSGTAAVLTVMTILRWTCPSFKKIIEPSHYDYMGRVFLTLGLLWSYLFFNEFIPHYYAHDNDVMYYFWDIAFHRWAIPFWIMFFTNFLCPVVALSFREFRRWIPGMFILSIGVNIGMYIERMIIVVNGLETYNNLTRNVHYYFPSFTELSVIAGSFAAVILGYMLFVRVFPILPIWELLETKARQKEHKIAGRKVVFFQWE